MPAEDLTEVIRHARLRRSKECLNDVIFIWLTDKNLFTIAALKNSQNDRLNTSVATKKKDVGAKCFLHIKMTFSQQMTVTLSVSKFDYKGLIFIDFRTKIDEIYYCNVFLSQ